MKGFKDKDGTFHPINNNSGLKMKANKSLQATGIPLKPKLKAEGVAPKLIDADIHRQYYDFDSEGGKITSLMLGNLSDAGFFWHGDEESINHFIVMMAGFKDNNQFISDMKEAGVTLDMLRPQMLENISGKLVDDETDDGLYAMSGGDSIWRFGNLPEVDLNSELSGWDYFGDGKEFTASEIELIENEFWNHFDDIGYEDFLEEKGEEWRNNLRKLIVESTDIEDIIGELESEGHRYDRWEMYDELRRPKIDKGINEAVKALQKEGKLRKK